MCLDIGAGTDLSQAPFAHQRQCDHARRVLRIPLDSSITLAATLLNDPALVHLFNIGHCGSTLVHRALKLSKVAWCVSEQLFAFDLVMGRAGLSTARLTALMSAGLRFLRQYSGSRDQRRVVVKHFSQVTTIIPEPCAAEPAAASLFLYREGESWCDSSYGFVQRMGAAMIVPPDERGFGWWILSGHTPVSALDGIVDMAGSEVTFDRLAAVVWDRQMQSAYAANAAGVPLLGLRYDDLLADRAGALATVLRHCGLPGEALLPALAAFDADSHEGTRTSRSIAVARLTELERQRIWETLAHPHVGMTGQERIG